MGEILEYSNVWANSVVKAKVDMAIFEMQAEISKTMANPLRGLPKKSIVEDYNNP